MLLKLHIIRVANDKTSTSVTEEFPLLGCYAMWLLQGATFRRNISPHHQGGSNQRARNKAVTSNCVPPKRQFLARVTRRHITEQGIIHSHRHQNLNSYNLLLYSLVNIVSLALVTAEITRQIFILVIKANVFVYCAWSHFLKQMLFLKGRILPSEQVLADHPITQATVFNIVILYINFLYNMAILDTS
jgi:hypothetical protein